MGHVLPALAFLPGTVAILKLAVCVLNMRSLFVEQAEQISFVTTLLKHLWRLPEGLTHGTCPCFNYSETLGRGYQW